MGGRRELEEGVRVGGKGKVQGRDRNTIRKGNGSER